MTDVQDDRIAAVVADVRQVLARHDLEWDDFPQAFRYHATHTGLSEDRHTRAMRAAEAVVRDGRPPDDLEDFRILIHEVNDLLNVEMDGSALDPGLTRALKVGAKVVSWVLFAIISYVLIGGLVTGQSALLRDQGWLALALFVFLLGLLAAVEALHISVTLLRLADLNAVRDEYPRTFRTHEIFRHELGTERFLAGRQLFVIMTVFFAAQLTSFPDMTTIPGTSFEVGPFVKSVFLEKGIAGALFVLWFGQLTPQFYANRRPKHFMNNWVISKLFAAALFMESIGVTKPGGWLAARVPAEAPVPVSAEERYRQAVEEIDGTGMVGVKKIWTISEGAAAKLSCDLSYRFETNGVQATHDESISVAGSISGMTGEATLLGDDGTPRELHAPGPTLARKDDGSALIEQTAQPRLGPFQKGDVLVLHTELDFPRASGLDRVSITEPTQYLLLRVELGGDPKLIRGARVQGFKIGDAPTADVMEGRRPILDEDLELTRTEDGTPCFEFTLWYPEMNSHYFMAWEADYAMN